jgi:hypothetical protein
MSCPVIVAGMNRSGSKLIAYLIAHAFGFDRVRLEPFSWDDGIVRASELRWEPLLGSRRPSVEGKQEHLRLPVWSAVGDESAWLSDVLNQQAWDVVKFVEIGRMGLYRTLCPRATIVGLIRHPVAQMASLAGSGVPKRYIAAQWHRLRREQGLHDPLPDAEHWLPADLADCARAYKTLHGSLAQHAEWFNVRVAYDALLRQDDWLDRIGAHLGKHPMRLAEPPRVGLSTREPLSYDAERYVEDRLLPTYHRYLSGGTVAMAQT